MSEGETTVNGDQNTVNREEIIANGGDNIINEVGKYHK